MRRLLTRWWYWTLDYAYVGYWQARGLLTWVRRNRHLDPAVPLTWVHRNRHLDPAGPCRAPVLLIPGIYEAWRFLEPIARRLFEAGHPVHVVPTLGLNHGSVRAMADLAAAYVREADLRGAVIVAHSKGGLIGKQLMLDEAAADVTEPAGTTPAPPCIVGMVAINTPFGGSHHATYFPLAAVRALSPAALRSLGEQRAVNARITSVFASWDPHIPGGAELAGATNVRVAAMGHFRVIADTPTQDAVLAAVAQYDAA